MDCESTKYRKGRYTMYEGNDRKYDIYRFKTGGNTQSVYFQILDLLERKVISAIVRTLFC